MGSFSIWHWLIVLAVVLILFGGGGKLSRLMGDFGKGLKSFKKQMRDEKDDEGEPKPITNETASAQAARPEAPATGQAASPESDKAVKG